MADNASITILRNTKANIDAEPIKDGNILFTTDQEKNKIYTDVGTRRIQIGGTVDVDTELSTTSTNPVANRVITKALLDGTVDVDTELSETSTNPVENRVITKALHKIRSHVGQIIISTALDTEQKVIDIYGGTKWTKIEGRFLLGASNTYPINTTGGSADSVVVSHTHSIPALSGTTASNGAHTHNLYDSASKTRYGHAYTVAAGQNAWSIVANPGASNTIIAQSAGAHTHSVTTNASTTGSRGVSGAGKNMPPYKAVYIWERIQ